MPEPTAADYALVDKFGRYDFDQHMADDHSYYTVLKHSEYGDYTSRTLAARAVAACRAEYEARIADAEKHADEETKADAEGWRNGQAQVQRDFDLLYADHQALKARLALAEAVCEWERHNRLLGDSQVNPHLSAWRAAK